MMKTQRNLWLLGAAAVLALSALACGLNTARPTPTQEPPIRVPATQLPLPTLPPVQNMDGMIGSWLDPDANGTVTTIIADGRGYAVESVINADRGGNELTETNWSNGALTWTYCIPGGNCITSKTTSIDGDSLSTEWTENGGSSGETTLQRTAPVSLATPSGNYEDMIGSWRDPDTETISTIMGLDGGLAIDSVVNPGRGGNEYASSSWTNGVLTWVYCVPGGRCITTRTTAVNGDSLETDWSSDNGNSGSTTFQRASAAPVPDLGPVEGLAGRWLDPDTEGDYHLVVWDNNQYVVAATFNPQRGGNEVTESSWANGLLTWKYCVPDGPCVTTKMVSVTSCSMETTWTNDEGKSGSTTLECMP